MKTVAIVNPTAGHHRAGRMWPVLLANLPQRASHLTSWWTEAPGQAELLAARARRQGYDRVLAVGGDGTLFEVANGLWWEPQGRLPSLGFVPLGLGCDYARNFTRGLTWGDAVLQALGEATVDVTVAILLIHALEGQPRTRVCLNVLGLGFDAQVVARMKRQRALLGGKIPYIFTVLQELLRHRHFSLRGTIDGEPFASRASLLAAGLGRYYGGGMMITPAASPQARRLQVVWDEGLGRLALLSLLRKVYSGGHLSHPRVQSRFGRRLELTADPPALVQVEGELVGQTPLAVELAPGAMTVAAVGVVLP